MWGPRFWVTSWCERFIKTEPSRSGCWRLAGWRKSTLSLANLTSGFWGSLPVRDILSTNHGGKILQWSGMWGWSWIIDTMTRWWFQIFFNFHLYLGKDVPIWRAYFSDGLVQPPTRLGERMFREISKGVFFCLKFPQLPQLWTWQEHNPAKLKSRVLIVERRYAARKLKGVWHGMAWLVADLGGGGVKLEKRWRALKNQRKMRLNGSVFHVLSCCLILCFRISCATPKDSNWFLERSILNSLP